MTQEEKQLLLKDLCARLPYGVKVLYWHHKNGGAERRVGELANVDLRLNCDELVFRINQYYFESDSIATSKPYLRPMSSMTGEECITLSTLMPYVTDAWKHIKTPIPLYIANIEQFDFFHRHHLDWRGLIQKGLALEAPEGMYEV